MDLRLPGIDGLETTQILKNNSLTKDIPVWAVTAYAMQGDEEMARAAGCCEYITKPTNTQDFIKLLRNFLNKLTTKEQTMHQPKILIVDDDENNRMVLSDALEGEQYTLLEAVNGNDA